MLLIFLKIIHRFRKVLRTLKGSFMISIVRSADSPLDWTVSVDFVIHLHIKDLQLLEKNADTFGVGIAKPDCETTARFEFLILNNYKLSLIIFLNNHSLGKNYAISYSFNEVSNQMLQNHLPLKQFL